MADLDSTLLDLSATNFKSSDPQQQIYIPTQEKPTPTNNNKDDLTTKVGIEDCGSPMTGSEPVSGLKLS